MGLTNPAQLLQLMYSHVLLDIAHMGETSSQETIALASAHNNYPLMYSHGGLRDDSPNCAPQADGPLGKASDITERSLGISQAQQLAALSGMIGLGTSGLTHNSSPVDQWLSAYRQALQLMASANGGLPRGVTFGTDMNGLSPQIAFDTQPTTYPITVASTTSPPPGVATPGLPAFAKMGNQNVLYDFQKDGIANYGMLPDFIQALSQRPNAFPVIKALYSTAEDVIETWEAAENVLVINPSSSVEPAFLNVLFGTAIPLPGPVTTTASTAYTATGYIGKQYTETLSVSGGVPPYTWQQNTQYPMPPGLSFNSNGTITGTPTTIGTYTVTVSALDSASPSAVASQWFTIKIQAAP
jgi:hypothetical protein